MSSDDECKSRLARRLKRRSIANYNFTKRSRKNSFKMEDVHIDLDEHDEDVDDNARCSNDCHDDDKTEKNNEQVGDPQPNMCLDDDVVDRDYKIFLENLRVDGGNFVFTPASGIPVRYEADAESSSDPEIIAVGKSPFCGGDCSPFISSKCDSIIDLDSKKSNGSPGSSRHSQFRMRLMEILGRPYTKEKYEDLLHEVSYKKPLEHQRILHGRTISYALDSFGKSYLDQYQDFRGKIALAQHDRHCQDFYNFDDDRKLEHFKPGQIWAAQYRANLSNFRYARVDRNSEGAVLFTWLKPNPVSIGEKRWCDEGLPIACGSFDLNPKLNSEERWPMVPSYKCSWDHGEAYEEIEIYSREGEIWALYKDWNLDEWVYNLDFVKGCKFQLVEIIHFSKYLGSDGACLVKVDSFRKIFER